jgi:transforming growth factor-beta-induced protein
MKVSMKILYVPLFVALLSACSDNDNTAETRADNIVESARADASFSTLITALEATGLDTVLADESREFTVFAPTNAAFEKLDPAALTSLLNDPDTLSDILLYHVVTDSNINSTAAITAAGSTLTTANTDDIGVALKGTKLYINGAQVVRPDINTSHGVIHGIDTVLIPTTDNPASGNIAEVATAAGSFGTLLNALAATGLDSVLSDPSGKFTVFAPTDAAFAKLGDISGLSNEQLTDILLYHVVVGSEVNAAAAAAIAGNTITMGNSDKLALSLSGSNLFTNLSQVSAADVDASNGIIHVIDSVLIPPAEVTTPTLNLVEMAQSSADFSTLVSALQATGLDTTLADPNAQFTVFAPTNAAFDALGAGAVAGLLGDLPQLTNILTRHVVSGSVDSRTAFTLNGTDVTTVNAATVAVSIMPDQFRVDNSAVTTFDIRTTNGIIHVIDAVITAD